MSMTSLDKELMIIEDTKIWNHINLLGRITKEASLQHVAYVHIKLIWSSLIKL